jgi:hypothetical protein
VENIAHFQHFKRKLAQLSTIVALSLTLSPST